MVDVFISYARKDTDFVLRLFNELKTSGHDAWVDWQDIEYAEDWWQKICAGIEAADNFVFVITPASIRSKPCFDEIEHATKHNKRIVPLLREQVIEAPDNERMHPSIRKHNWLPFQDDITFESQLTDLLTTIDQDPLYVKNHTRFLVRALDWKTSGEKHSLLLREDDLNTAERWLAESQGKEPASTVLHQKYIIESRRIENEIKRQERRLRWAAIVAGLIGLIALVVAVFSGSSALNARNDQQTAIAGANTASKDVINAYATLTPIPVTLNAISTQIAEGEDKIISLDYASKANEVLQSNGGNAETAALLAIRGLKTAYSPQADAALVKAKDRLDTLQIFNGHISFVSGVVFSPDGKTALTGSWDDTIRLWDTATGSEIRQFSAGSLVNSVAFSPDGNLVLTGHDDNTARVWDTATGTEIRQFLGHTNAVNSVAFSHDGKFVLTGSGDTSARLWDTATGTEIRQFSGHTKAVNSGVFSSNGKFVLTGSYDDTTRLWDLTTGTEIHRFTAHIDGIYSIYTVAFSPDNKFILTGSGDTSAHLWDAATGTEIRQFTGHTDRVSTVAFSPNGRFVLTGSYDNTARLWDTTTGTEIRQFTGHTDFVNSVAFSPDGKFVLTGSNDTSARLWNTTADKIHTFTGHTDFVNSVTFSPDGKFVLTGSNDNTARLWEATTGTEIRPFTGHIALVSSVAFSPDGNYVLTGSNDTSARLWDVATGAEIRQFTGHTFAVESVAFSPDGKYVLTGSNDTSACLWDAATGAEIRQFTGHTFAVESVAFSPDGKYVFTGSADNTASLWDTAAGTEIRQFTGHTDGVTSVAFSHTGKYVLTGSYDNIASLWDTATGTEIRQFTGHTDGVTSVAFSHTDKFIITGSRDNTARLWDTATGTEIRQFTGHINFVNSVAINPDDKFIVTGSNDTSARLWNTDYRDFIIDTCSHIFHDFTEGEFYQYVIIDNKSTCSEFGGWIITPTNTLIATPYVPVWTPIATPTVSITPITSNTPDQILTDAAFYTDLTATKVANLMTATVITFTPSATSGIIRPAQLGANRGDIPDTGGEIWTYLGQAGENLNITIEADHPAMDRTSQEPDPEGLDTYIIIRDPDGIILLEADDIDPGIITNTLIESLVLPVDGVYKFEIRSWDNTIGGGYTLTITSNLSGTGTPTPTTSPTPSIVPIVTPTP